MKATIRPPAYGDYEKFQRKTIELFAVLSGINGNIQIPDLANRVTGHADFQVFTEIMGVMLKMPSVTELIEDILFDYLKFSIEDESFNIYKSSSLQDQQRLARRFWPWNWLGFKNQTVSSLWKSWARKNVRMDEVFRIFVAILNIDEIIKKNAQSELGPMLPAGILQQSTVTSGKNTDGTQGKSMQNHISQSVSF